MNRIHVFMRNILITTVISAMLMTSVCTVAFAAEEPAEAPVATEESVMPEDYVSSVTATNIDGEAIESQIVYYLNTEDEISMEDGSVVDAQINYEGILMDAEGSVVPALMDIEGNTIKTQLDEDGNMISALIDADGNIIDDNGEFVEADMAYLTDEDGSMINNNIYMVTADGMIIGAVCGFHVDEEFNVVDDAGEVVIPAPSEGAVEGSLTEVPEEEAEPEEETKSFDVNELEEITVPEDDDFIVIEDLDTSDEINAKATAKGWKTVNGHKMYYYDSKNYYKSTRAVIDGAEYAFDKNGYLITGKIFVMDGNKYAALADGKLAVGIFNMGSSYYCANLKTKIVREKEGFFKLDGKKYYSAEGGKLVCSKSFTVNGKEYISGADGHIKTGAFKYNKKMHYADPETGVVNTKGGWIKNGSKTYYAKEDGHLYTNKFKKIDGSTYYFNAKGVMVKGGVFEAHDGNLYFAIPENNHIKVKAEIVSYNKKLYYVTDGGKIKTSRKFKVDGKTYVSRKDGHICKGIFMFKGSYYYANSKGEVRTDEGLQTKSGKTYYVTEGGKLLTSKFKTVDKNKYYFSKKASALVGKYKFGNVRYTFNKNGVVVKKEYLEMKGIDVSYAQKSIDWKKVKADGIDFAIIRVGYSGSSSGKSMEDDWFRNNIKGAKEAGLKVGVYYFTTAMTAQQGAREANFTTNIVETTGYKLDLPVVIDSEALPGSLAASKRGGNYNKLGKAERTAAVKAFCEQTVKNGYTPMIYASTSWLNSKLDMGKLDNYKVWVAQYNTKVTYGGNYCCWQYTSSGKVNGIKGSVDMNIWYGYDK